MTRGIPTVVILTLLILSLHALGSVFSLYERVFWFDMVMHTLGGAWLASVFVVIGTLRYPSLFAGRSRPRFVLRTVSLVLIAGLAWEFYEYLFAVWATSEFGNLGFHQPSSDTASDLILDAAGAAAVALLFASRARK